MPIPTVDQTLEDFGAIAPGASAGVSLNVTAPSNSTVTLSVDGSAVFSINSLTTWAWQMEAVDPGELPPGHKGPPPKHRVLEQVGQFDGTGSFTVLAGQIIKVGLSATMPTQIPAQANGYSGSLAISGTGWDAVQIPLKASLSHVNSVLGVNNIAIAQGDSGHLAISSTSIAGPDTTVQFFLHDGPESEGVVMDPASLLLPSGASASQLLTLRVAPNAVTGTRTLFFSQTAFNGAQRDSVVPGATLTIGPGDVIVSSPALVSGVVAAPGSTVQIELDVTLRGSSADLYFKSESAPASVSISPQNLHVEVGQSSNVLVPLTISAQSATGPQQSVVIRWSAYGGEKTGTLEFPLTVVPDAITLHQPVITPSGTALGGWVEMTLRKDGTYVFTGHMHDSGFDPYDFHVRAVVTAAGVAVAAQKSGHVDGTGSNPLGTPNRDFDWQESGVSADVRDHWASMWNAQLAVSKSYNDSGLLGVVENLAKDLISFLVSETVFGEAVGLVIVVGSELASAAHVQLGPGGLVGIAVAAGTVLVFGKGVAIPALIAGVAAGAAVDALVKWRAMTADEANWAAAVFGNTLPPADRVILTNLTGLGGREFTTPNVDGTILLNLGDGYHDPTHIVRGVYSAPGQVFIHELTHAWQILHSDYVPGTMCDGISNQLRRTVLGENVYAYGPPQPSFGHDYNLEQQAAIVDQWFGGNRPAISDVPKSLKPGDEGDAYFRYIAENIRMGQP